MGYFKPFSPYAKLLDQCSMSTQQSFTLQTIDPLSLFNLGTSYTYYLVGDDDFAKVTQTGSSTNNDACWPGRLDWLFYRLERGLSTATRWQTTVNAGQDLFHTDLTKEPEIDEEEKGFLSNYVGPYLQNMIVKLIDSAKEQAMQFE